MSLSHRAAPCFASLVLTAVVVGPGEAAIVSYRESTLIEADGQFPSRDELSVPPGPPRDVVASYFDPAVGIGSSQIDSRDGVVTMQGAVPAYRPTMNFYTHAFMEVVVENETPLAAEAVARIRIDGGFLTLIGAVAQEIYESLTYDISYTFTTSRGEITWSSHGGFVLYDSVVPQLSTAGEDIGTFVDPTYPYQAIIPTGPIIEIPLGIIDAYDRVVVHYSAGFGYYRESGPNLGVISQWSFKDPAGVAFDGSYGVVELRPAAVPEPPSLALVGLPALLGLAALRRRAKAAARSKSREHPAG